MKHEICYRLALGIQRMVLGAVFIAHGSQKVLGLFGGPGLAGFASWAQGFGISMPLAYLAAFAEFFGGLLLFFGLATEFGVLSCGGVMAGAIWFIHWGHGYFVQNGGFEYPLILILFMITILIAGPGYGALWDPFAAWRK